MITREKTPKRGAFDYLLAPIMDEVPQAPPPPPPERGGPPRVRIEIEIVQPAPQPKPRGYRFGTLTMTLIALAALASLVGGCTSSPANPGLITTTKFDYNTIVKSEYSWVPGACMTHETMDDSGRTGGDPIVHLPDGRQYAIFTKQRPSYQWLQNPTATLPVCASETAEAARRHHQFSVAFQRDTARFQQYYRSQSPAAQAEMRRLDAQPIDPGYTTFDTGDGVLRTWSNDQRAGHFHGCDSVELSGTVQTSCY
jgi:hypothetical protein